MKSYLFWTLFLLSTTAVVLEPTSSKRQPLNAFLEFGRAIEDSQVVKAKAGLPTTSVDFKSLVKKDVKEIKTAVERMLFSDDHPDIKSNNIVQLNDALREQIFANMEISRAERKERERRLADDDTTITRNQVAQGNDEISSSGRLEEIKDQERAMSNYQRVHSWLDDVNFKMMDLRSNINRRLQDMSVGLQRRSLLLGHYNYVGQGIGAPNGESMSDMNPYFHF